MGKRDNLAARRQPTMAEAADRHELYETSVQDVETEVDFLLQTFRERRGREPATFREDFCGTASASCEWVRRGDDKSAIGVDFDRPTLDWGRTNRVARLPDAAQARVRLIEADVLEVDTAPVDVVGAFNFSYWTFRTREQMRHYFERVRAALDDDGLFMLDAFGGSEAYEEMREKTKHDDFTYIWEQAVYHPVSGYMKTHIHFKFPDGSKLKKAFTYEWRLWSLPEIRELLLEAGFADVTVYWEGEDEDGEGNGEFEPDTEGAADPGWIVYIVATK